MSTKRDLIIWSLILIAVFTFAALAMLPSKKVVSTPAVIEQKQPDIHDTTVPPQPPCTAPACTSGSGA